MLFLNRKPKPYITKDHLMTALKKAFQHPDDLTAPSYEWLDATNLYVATLKQTYLLSEFHQVYRNDFINRLLTNLKTSSHIPTKDFNRFKHYVKSYQEFK